MRIRNPFCPSQPAFSPHEFFGRLREIREATEAIGQGSVLLEGGVGIGKTSLLANLSLSLEGFASGKRSIAKIAVGHGGIKTIDDAAAMLVHQFVSVDEVSNRVTLLFGKILTVESSAVVRHFRNGQHIETLKKILDAATLNEIDLEQGYLIIAIDEVDKCVGPVTQLIRVLWTHLAHQHISNVRFVVAGVYPLMERMVGIDEGIRRCFYKRIVLGPLNHDEGFELLEDKFHEICADALKSGNVLSFRPRLFSVVSAISGGHPHVLQLFGSLIVDRINEDEHFDIESNDLLSALFLICKEQRNNEYQRTFHELELHGMTEAFARMMSLATERFPTRVGRTLAQESLSNEELRYLLDHRLISLVDQAHYGLVDEFVWVWLDLANCRSINDVTPTCELLEQLKRFEILQTRETLHETQRYLTKRFHDELYDAEKKTILLEFIRTNAGADGWVDTELIVKSLHGLFGSPAMAATFMNELAYESVIARSKSDTRRVRLVGEAS